MSTWNLRNNNNELIAPLIYTNKKSQEDIVKEITEMFKSYDVVSTKGGVGSGKSIIALRLISNYGSGIIVVPTKILEHQYVEDYCTGNKYHLDQGESNLPINFMFGKGNFSCKFLPTSCMDPDIPCTQKVNANESRVQVASRCPHWSPIYSTSFAEQIEKHLQNHEQCNYQSISGDKTFFCSNDPCEYYKQFAYYTIPGAIIMNLAKWEIETWIGRKPQTPIEIIDEGDALLDNLSYRTTITPKLFASMRREKIVDESKIDLLQKEYNDLCFGEEYEGPINKPVMNFLQDFSSELDSESGSVFNTISKINMILNFSDVAYVQTKRDQIIIFLSRPDITFSEMKKRSGKILLMSATMPSQKILSSVFKLDNIPLVEAEPRFPGTLKIMCTKQSMNITYKNWITEGFQQKYFNLLNKIISVATRPTLVQVHAIKYIPPNCKDLLNRGFLNGVSWSTVTDRGMDFPDDKCRSIVITKFPLPDISDITFRVLQKTLDESTFWGYMRDIANRDLIQQCGRAVRHRNDWCEIWSPDSQVTSNIWCLWKGNSNLIEINNIGEKQNAI